MRLIQSISKIKDTILYYISVWWLESWIYLNIVHKSNILEQRLKNVKTYKEAEMISNTKQFKWISKSYKRKLINKYIKQH